MTTYALTPRALALLAVTGLLIALAPVATAAGAAGAESPAEGFDLVVDDARQDAEGDPAVRGLAELSRVRYVVQPSRSRLAVTARFARMVDGTRTGTVRQTVGVLLSQANGRGGWLITASNKSGRARIFYEDYDGDDSGPVESDALRVSHDSGPHGSLRVDISTEFAGRHRVSMRTVTQVGEGRAWDFSGFTRPVRLN